MHKTKSGFTIVELLIVIVVIGVLAAITVVAFNGVQQRAKNVARDAVASQMLKIVNAYVAINGKTSLKDALPTTDPTFLNAFACVGNGFVDANADSRPDCFSYTPTQTQAVSSNATIDAALSSVGISGSGVYPTLDIGGIYTTNGAWLDHNSSTTVINNEAAPLIFGYWIAGANQKCSIGTQYRYDRTEAGITYYVDDPATLNYSVFDNTTLCAVHVK